jgi:hypothetical protein
MTKDKLIGAIDDMIGLDTEQYDYLLGLSKYELMKIYDNLHYNGVWSGVK